MTKPNRTSGETANAEPRGPADENTRPGDPPRQAQGISNRETSQEEDEERQEHPPIRFDPSVEHTGGVGAEPHGETGGRQTSHKAGSRSVAQKEAGSKYADRSHPASHKVNGAFGREPRDADGVERDSNR
jgi:hypothetical protein